MVKAVVKVVNLRWRIAKHAKMYKVRQNRYQIISEPANREPNDQQIDKTRTKLSEPRLRTRR
jgi:hypothetical protein